MSLHLEMLQVARLAPQQLGDAAELIIDFVRSSQTAEGGFGDRDGHVDIYYTWFGIACLIALHQPLPEDRLRRYLAEFADGEGLDFVHLTSLIRCRASLSEPIGVAESAAFAARLEAFRAIDGGFHHAEPGNPMTSAYGAMLGLGALQDLGLSERAGPLGSVLARMQTADGAYANEPGMPIGSTTATAAAVTTLRNLGIAVSQPAADWLFARHYPRGGFFATPASPIPDLLSTATALHALSGMRQDLRPIREACLDYLDTLWTSKGGFFGHWAEEALDCEYSYYGLLALGHLS
jgi:prenyltransferase beta subunit